MASAGAETVVSSETPAFGSDRKPTSEVDAAGVRISGEDSLAGAVGGSDPHRIRSGSNGGSSAAGCQSPPISAELKAEINKKIQLLEQIQIPTDIPQFLHDVPLESLSENTKQSLVFFLDPLMDIPTSEGLCKDYRGVAEWLKLDDAFQRYIAKIDTRNKFNEVLSMWEKDAGTEGIPKAEVGQLQECLLAIDRLDAIETLAAKITRDAMQWKKSQLEADVRPPDVKDLSWQLTRHDVLYGKKTYYTACLMFADEDYGMAQIIMKLYKSAKKDSLFFLPQFDLKVGKYILNDTAEVIDARCGRKVIFLLSKYFFASKVCQFAVYYTAYHGAGNGNLIPFHLTRDVDHVPNVLKGIAGVRWFRKGTREHSWSMLTDGLFMEKIEVDELQEVKSRIQRAVEDSRDDYLCDPPYDEDVPEAGEPIEIEEPESSIPLPIIDDLDKEPPGLEKDKKKWKLLKSVQKVVYEKLFGRFNFSGKCCSGKSSQAGPKQLSPGCKSPGTEMLEMKGRPAKQRLKQKTEKDIVNSKGHSSNPTSSELEGTEEMNQLDQTCKPNAINKKDNVNAAERLRQPSGESDVERTGLLDQDDDTLSDRSDSSESLRYETTHEKATGPRSVESKENNNDVNDGIAVNEETCRSASDTNAYGSNGETVEKLKMNIEVPETFANNNNTQPQVEQEDQYDSSDNNERAELTDDVADSLSEKFVSCVSGQEHQAPEHLRGGAGDDLEEESPLCSDIKGRGQETVSAEGGERQPLL